MMIIIVMRMMMTMMITLLLLFQGVSFIGWHQRSRLERVLLVLTTVLALAVLLTVPLLLAMRGPTYLPVPPCYQPEPKGGFTGHARFSSEGTQSFRICFLTR